MELVVSQFNVSFHFVFGVSSSWIQELVILQYEILALLKINWSVG